MYLETNEHYKEQVRGDERRWKNADLDKDNKLSKEEFVAYIQPWDFDHMKDVVAMETLEDVDDDNDSYVSLDEYMCKIPGIVYLTTVISLLSIIDFVYLEEC